MTTRRPTRTSTTGRRTPRRTAIGALAQAAGGAVLLGLLTALLASRLVTTTGSVDLAVLRSGAPTMGMLAPLVEIPLLGTGCVVAAWWSLSLALVTLALLGQSVGVRSALLTSCIRAVAPAAVRRLAVAGISAGLVLTAGPALAAEPVPDLGWVSTGTSTPDATGTDPVDTSTPDPDLVSVPVAPPTDPPPPETDSTEDPTTVTVAAGDSLWSISESLLPPGASAAEIAAAWPAIHAANAATIGADPDVIVVGQTLLVPPPAHPTPSP